MQLDIQEYKEGMELKGFIANMPIDVYHDQKDFISNSGLSLIAKSPAHYVGEKRKQTAALKSGSLFHQFMLEPDWFSKYYVQRPELPDRRCKAFNQAAATYGKERVLTGPEIEVLQGMAKGLQIDPRVKAYLDRIVYTELSLFTQCPRTGIKVRVRFDAITSDGVALDPKTTRDASQEGFSRAITEYRYNVQDVLYSDAFYWHTGQTLQNFIFIAAEEKPPYIVVPYETDNIAKHMGRHEYNRCLDIYQQCLETGVWNGYPVTGERANLNSVTEWAIRQFEDEVGLEGGL